MSDIIKLLPDSVANQIAAGEVIQRPASVIKELVENSVDAGAGNITVIIKDAGRTSIQVVDDGTGMSETDARLSFERHATSKISDASDLFSITTKGFRGEALASIAGVAQVELKTRRWEDEAGTLISIAGSKIETQEPCACAPGTNITVKNLFFNIPARRKFLKSDNTETRHIISEFQKVAMAHPNIRFTLISNDSEIYSLPSGNLRQRIVSLFGKPLNQHLVPVTTETTLVKISGFLGKPEAARKSPGEQFFFVNNRYMRHPYFHRAVTEGFHNLLPTDAIPVYFIFLETDPATIDVNIHPTKTEIKFEEERAIWQIVLASVRESLGKFSVVPPMDFDVEGYLDFPVRSGTSVPPPPAIEIDTSFNPFGNDSSYNRSSIRFDQGGREKSEGWENLYNPTGEIPSGDENRRGSDLTNGEIVRRFMQLRNRYILCPVKSGLMVIDQRRAHQRILYEKFTGILSDKERATQTTLFPVTMELSAGDMLIVEEISDALVSLGFEIRQLGKNEISVTGIPADSWNTDPAEMVKTVIEDYRSTDGNNSMGTLERTAASLAMASSINHGTELSIEEMSSLFDSLFACSNPNYSPSGKAIINIISTGELEKRLDNP